MFNRYHLTHSQPPLHCQVPIADDVEYDCDTEELLFTVNHYYSIVVTPNC